jgi:hypothetical protein
MNMNKEEALNKVMAMAVKVIEEKLIMTSGHPDTPDYLYAKNAVLKYARKVYSPMTAAELESVTEKEVSLTIIKALKGYITFQREKKSKQSMH